MDIRGKEIYRWVNDNPDERRRMIDDEATEYVVCEDTEACSGIVVYCRYGNNEWTANSGERALIKHLLAELERVEDELKKLKAENKTIKMERNILAMLSADDPQFFYPHGVSEAKTLRDRILLGKPLES